MLLDPNTRFEPDLGAAALNARYHGRPAEDVLHAGLRLYGGEVALVSSFGAESAVLLHMAAQINPHVPVLMVDTQMLFVETLEYQERLSDLLGLTDVRRIRPDEAKLAERDPYDALHLGNPDACCALRKIEPLERALDPFGAWISGRKRYQGGKRSTIEMFEPDGFGRIKVNPLATWNGQDLKDYMSRHELPQHPLVAQNYLSIGCRPCTTPVAEGEDPRAGRWRGTGKDECGIHFGPDGRVQRTAA